MTPARSSRSPSPSPSPTISSITDANDLPTREHTPTTSPLPYTSSPNLLTQFTRHSTPPLPRLNTSLPADTAAGPALPHSNIWTPRSDALLASARSRRLNWHAIASQHFPGKTANACRKRHERLRGARDHGHTTSTSTAAGDGSNEVKRVSSAETPWSEEMLEKVAQRYMKVRSEMWSMLAQEEGFEERWEVTEAKCMDIGLVTLVSAAKAAQRREPSVDNDRIHSDGSLEPQPAKLNHPNPQLKHEDPALLQEQKQQQEKQTYQVAPTSSYPDHIPGRTSSAFDSLIKASVMVERRDAGNARTSFTSSFGKSPNGFSESCAFFNPGRTRTSLRASFSRLPNLKNKDASGGASRKRARDGDDDAQDGGAEGTSSAQRKRHARQRPDIEALLMSPVRLRDTARVIR